MKFKDAGRNLGDGAFNAIPMKLQMFAEGAGDGTGEGDAGQSGSGHGEGEGTPSYEELAAQLARYKADMEKYKNLSDKFSREASETKKQLTSKLSAEEQEKIAMREADEAKDARIKELEERMAVIDNTSFWGGSAIGMDEKAAKATAEAEATGDKEKFREHIARHIKAIRDSAYQQALADRPSISAGNGPDDKNSTARELAVRSARQSAAASEEILKHYRR